MPPLFDEEKLVQLPALREVKYCRIYCAYHLHPNRTCQLRPCFWVLDVNIWTNCSFSAVLRLHTWEPAWPEDEQTFQDNRWSTKRWFPSQYSRRTLWHAEIARLHGERAWRFDKSGLAFSWKFAQRKNLRTWRTLLLKNNKSISCLLLFYMV